MNILLFEDESVPINSLKLKLKSVYPGNCTLHVSRDNADRVLTKIKTRPLLKDNWCIYLNSKLELDIVKKFFITNNVNILLCNNKEDFEKKKDKLLEEKIEFKLVDNTKFTRDILVNFLIDNLKISETNAVLVCKRMRNYPPLVYNAYLTLSSFTNINETVIKKYLTKSRDVSFISIEDAVLGMPLMTSKKKIFDLIYEYRNSGYLIEYLAKSFKEYLDIYTFISDGILTQANYMEFKKEYSEMFDLSKIRDYKFKRTLYIYNYVSYEKLYYYYLKLSNFKKKKSYMFELITLIGGNK